MASIAACGGEATSADSASSSQLRLMHGFVGVPAIDLIVDGAVVVNDLAFGQASPFVPIASGSRNIELRAVSVTVGGALRQISFVSNQSYTLVALDSSGSLNPVVLSDTGAAPVAGASKLRVVHLATHAPAIDVWRTQPDFQTLIRVMFPFAYLASSPYLQSTPGDWSVVVTPEGGSSRDTLFATGAISVPAGQLRTVILLDAPGGGIGVTVIQDR